MCGFVDELRAAVAMPGLARWNRGVEEFHPSD